MTYINLDIRILHTLMYQVDLCYTDKILGGGCFLLDNFHPAGHGHDIFSNDLPKDPADIPE